MSENQTEFKFNGELCRFKHEAIDARLEKIEQHVETMNRPEDGTLAKMRQALEESAATSTERLESKMNYVLITIATMVGGALITILLKKLGFA